MEPADDFSSVGKRMPYRVPPGFFERLELQVRAEAARRRTMRLARRRIAWGGLTVAAVVAALCFLVGRPAVRVPAPADGLADIEQAFARLSAEDQAFVIEMYSDDVFLQGEDYAALNSLILKYK